MAQGSVEISVIIPALDEAQSLPELIGRLEAVLAGGPRYEVIVIDDGSTDDTWAVLKGLRAGRPHLSILRNLRNQGKSMALSQGLDVVRGDVVIMMDADLQDQPEAIPALLAKIAQGYDLVNGWRQQRNDSGNRVTVSRVYNRMTSRFLNLELHDINCGFKAMRREVAAHLKLRGDMHRLIPAIAAANGFKVTEVAVPHAMRKYGQSKYRLLRVNGLVDLLTIMIQSQTQARPFHFSIKIGLLCGLMGILCLGLFLGWSSPEVAVGSLVWVLRSLLGIVSIWLIFVATIMPLFGFHLEMLSSLFQDRKWRSSLLREKVMADEEAG
jgi:glycosyltransferase involved in cell wall biosynthesis